MCNKLGPHRVPQESLTIIKYTVVLKTFVFNAVLFPLSYSLGIAIKIPKEGQSICLKLTKY